MYVYATVSDGKVHHDFVIGPFYTPESAIEHAQVVYKLTEEQASWARKYGYTCLDDNTILDIIGGWDPTH